MDKGLQEIINKLNAQKPQTSLVSKETPTPKKEDDEEDDDPDFYVDDEEKKEIQKTDVPQAVTTPDMEMELLQNNGRFRAELLFQLQEINKALVVIAQVMMQKK